MSHRLARILVRIAALLAPRCRQDRLIREWLAELYHESPGLTAVQAVRHAAGAFADAWTLRRIEKATPTRGPGIAAWTGSRITEARIAVRGLRKSPTFTVVTVLTLSLGMGGSAAIYTMLDRVVLDPLPYPDPERLVQVSNRVPGVGTDVVWGASTAQQVFYAENATSLQLVGLFRALGSNMQTPEGPRRVSGWSITASVFTMLGASAQLGRLFIPADDMPGAPPVAVLSHGLWQRQFGGDTDVIGSHINVDGRPVEVIGVLESGVSAPIGPPGYASDVWLPLRIDPDGYFGNNHVYNMLGKLAQGVTPTAAESDLERLEPLLPERFSQAYSQSFFDGSGFYTQVVPLKQAVIGDLARNLWILFGSVGIVLLIACANVANLFVVRLNVRARELAIRRALGASRSALARLLLAEGMLLSIAGAVLALLVAWGGGLALLRFAPDSLPRMASVRMDGDTILFTAMLALIIGTSLGVYSLLRYGDGSGIGRLAGGRAFSAGRRRQRIRAVLVVTQVALAMTLLVAAGLLIESVRRMNSIDPGFEAHGVLTAELYLTPDRYDSDVQIWSTYSQILERVRAIPGVTSAGMAEELPVQGRFGCTVQGFDEQAVYDRLTEAGLSTCAGQERATPGYFQSIGIPVLRGRGLTDADHFDPTRGAVVVSKAFADRFWPNEDAIGKGVAPSGRTVEPFYRVVGVVGDHPAEALDGEPAIAVYYPVVHNPDTPKNWGWWRPTSMSLVVRADVADPASLIPAVRQAVAAVDPSVPIVRARAMEEIVAASTARVSFVSTLLGIAAFVALMLAAVGVYGVVSYVVGNSTREIGMRVAIGARPLQVEALFVRRSLALIGMGVLGGIGLAGATTRLLEGILYGVEPSSPGAFVVAAGVLALVAFVASWLPARRAAMVDPMEAFRTD